jgi:hypothetical protein
MTVLYSIVLLLIANCTSGDDIAGSVTETGNVTGIVMSSNKQKAANAKVSLYKKKSEVMSPDEQTKPVDEVYTNDTGYFSFKADAGNFTIIAVSNSEYAFRDSISPGKTGSKNMVIELRNPGKIKGIIKNTVELRGTGSVIVHLIGTSIYKNVDSEGSFLIDNVPAGTYTLVSYSTYQPEFSPKYQTVNVFSDSTTDLGGYSLTYNGIPIPKNVVVKYDTSNEEVRITWDSIGYYKDFQEYAIYRGIAGTAQHNLIQIGYTEGTSFVDPIQFTTDSLLKYEYSVLVNNKLGESGKYYGIYAVSCVPKFRLNAFAGEDQFVDIRTKVILKGAFSTPKYQIAKMEWKIGNKNWQISETGNMEFTTDSSFETERIDCMFRVSDIAGNVGIDTVVVIKQQLAVTLGQVPMAYNSMASTTVISWNFAEKDGKLWTISSSTENNKRIWSSADASDWKIENAASAINNDGKLFVCNNSFFYLNPGKKSYKSIDCKNWEEISTGLPMWVNGNNICIHKEKLYAIHSNYDDSDSLRDTLFVSIDAVNWTKKELTIKYNSNNLVSYQNNLYMITSGNLPRIFMSSDDGLTWNDNKLWDENYDVFPDKCLRLISNDSVMVAYYVENPGNINHAAILRNDKWYSLSQSVLKNSWGNGFIVFQNKVILFRQENSEIVLSAIKL